MARRIILLLGRTDANRQGRPPAVGCLLLLLAWALTEAARPRRRRARGRKSRRQPWRCGGRRRTRQRSRSASCTTRGSRRPRACCSSPAVLVRLWLCSGRPPPPCPPILAQTRTPKPQPSPTSTRSVPPASSPPRSLAAPPSLLSSSQVAGLSCACVQWRSVDIQSDAGHRACNLTPTLAHRVARATAKGGTDACARGRSCGRRCGGRCKRPRSSTRRKWRRISGCAFHVPAGFVHPQG